MTVRKRLKLSNSMLIKNILLLYAKFDIMIGMNKLQFGGFIDILDKATYLRF